MNRALQLRLPRILLLLMALAFILSPVTRSSLASQPPAPTDPAPTVVHLDPDGGDPDGGGSGGGGTTEGDPDDYDKMEARIHDTVIALSAYWTIFI
jgi:hypothetical protein